MDGILPAQAELGRGTPSTRGVVMTNWICFVPHAKRVLCVLRGKPQTLRLIAKNAMNGAQP